MPIDNMSRDEIIEIVLDNIRKLDPESEEQIIKVSW